MARRAGRGGSGRGHDPARRPTVAAGRSAMTVIGKILVFVYLVFSLLTAGLIVMVYTTRTNWFKAYTDQKAAVSVVQDDFRRAEAAQKEIVDRKDAEYQQLLATKT